MAATIRYVSSTTFSLAAQQNSYPLIRSLVVHNSNDDTSEDSRYLSPDLRLRLTSDPEIFSSEEWSIDSLAPGQSVRLPERPLNISHDFLFNQTEEVKVSMKLVLYAISEPESELAIEEFSIDVLPANFWGGETRQPELLAAFVKPNGVYVESLVKQVTGLLEKQGQGRSADGYQSQTREKPYLMAAYLWNVIFSQRLSYVSPPPGFARNGQRIRLPADISTSEMAACLDSSLLFASCLELMGLNSVIALTEQHAFVGVWLIDDCFPLLTCDDPMDLRKRVDSRDIVLFESTLATNDSPVTFEEARAAARELINEDKEEDFVYLLDVNQARARKIKPLSTIEIRPEEAGASTGGELPLPELPPLPPVRKDDQTIEETPDTRIDSWQRKLLDLTKRNALLNLRENAVAIKIYSPAIGELEDRLAEGKSFKFQAAEESPHNDDQRSSAIFRLQMGKSLHKEFALEQLSKEIVIANMPRKKLDANSVNLFRKAKNDLQEGGSNTLYLALGMLRWKENPEDDKSYRAPLILIPAELKRSSAKAPVKLKQLQDEAPIFNLTLIEFLYSEYDIDLNQFRGELPEDSSGVDVDGIWNTVRHAISEQPGFEVVEEVVLASFSFAKYLMWKDLKERLGDLKDNLFVKHLVDNPQEAYHQDTSFIEHKDVDTKIDPESMFIPLNCDSSQLVAVEASAKKQDFVLEGPPGTGKSETIANIICHNLALGRKVLFVAEKMAALNVVYRRMEKIGLDHLCLELHSNKANKKAVLEQLRSATSKQSSLLSESWVASVTELKQRRGHLNKYVTELHKKSDYGLSVRELIARDVFYKEQHSLSLGWPIGLQNPPISSSKDLENMLEVARYAGLAYADIAFLEHQTFKPITATNWSNAWQSQLIDILDRYKNLILATSEAADMLTSEINVAINEKTILSLHQISALSALIGSAQAFPMSYLFQKDRKSVVASIRIISESKRKFDSALKSIECGVSAEILEKSPIDDWSLLYEESKKHSRLHRFFTRFKINRAAKKIGYSKFEDLSVLAPLKEAQLLREQIASYADRLIADDIWIGWDTPSESLDEAAARAEEAYSNLSTAMNLANDPSEILSVMKVRLVDGRDFLDESKLVNSNNTFVQLFKSYSEVRQEADTLGLGFDSEDLLSVTTNSIDSLLIQAPKFKIWCSWQGAKKSAVDSKLAHVVDALENGILSPSETENQVLTAFCRWLAPQLIDASDVLVNFKSSNHEQLISEFRDLDAAIAANTSKYVAGLIANRSPDPFGNDSPAEFSILAREFQKKQRHKPVRQLFLEMGNRVLDLSPCMMMSPLSVAQFLPSNFKGFDLVVFDEASQMTTWDSVGAIARGENVIVVGDPKQMPPTSFFSGAVSDDNPDEEDLESILDQALAARLPHLRLQGHYRSRHETLIAFSNSKYYENALITYPSCDTKESAVSLHRVQGVYSKGKGRNNPIEAKAVVDEITRRLLDPVLQEKSIGVVTLNTDQQRTIEDLLDVARRTYPQIETFFNSTDSYDGVFIKNLESVQGDERDVIILSLGYGPTEPGGNTMSMNFGPLNKTGGERRLNVAITRATTEILVFSSFDSSMIDLSRSSALAVEHLKHYLEFAERGPIALAEQATADFGVDQFDSDFEQAVAWALREKGWKVQTQVGVSKFRIDMGVIHPDHPGEYLAGIECDGATYHGSPSARDRDRVRHDILERLGWNLVRLWSTDYFQDPQYAINLIDQKLAQLLNISQNQDSIPKLGQISEADPYDVNDIKNTEAKKADDNFATSESGEITSMISDIEPKVDESESIICPPFPEYNDKVFFDVSHQQNLNSLAKQILKRKNGITLHELAFDIAKCHGMSRQSKKQRTHLLNIIKSWVGLVRDGIHRPVVWYSPKDIAEEIPWRGIAPWGQNRDWRQIPFPEAIGLAKAALEKAPDDPVNFICDVFELKKRHPGTLDEFHSWIKSASL
jgi:very-short-patch-repair endonuclease